MRNERLTLPHNPTRDLALQDLPKVANVQIFTAAKMELQTVPLLRSGTYQRGRVGFGDQIGSRRLKVGDALLVMGVMSEAWICWLVGCPVNSEVLVLKKLCRSIDDFENFFR
jgi:hypothetical protein